MMKNFTKKFLSIFIFAMIVSTTGWAQIYWNFGVTAALSAYPTSGIPANITIDSVRGGNSTGTPFLSTTSASSGYTGFSAGGNAGLTAKAGPLDYTVNTATGSAFYEITLTPAAGYYVSVTGIGFGSRSTGTGPKKYSIRTDVDSYATEQAGDTINSATSAWGYRTQTLAINGVAGTAVKIRIYGYDGAGTVGAVNFRLDDLGLLATAVGANPTIALDPQDAAACIGSSAMFGITAFGAGSYQWEQNSGSGFFALSNGGVFSGVDTDTLMISDITGLNGNMYRCIAMNGSGNDTSASALLTVNPTVVPSVSISGPSTTICESDSVVGIATSLNPGSAGNYIWSVVGVGPVGNDSVLVIPAGTVPAGTYTVSCQMTSNAACASPATVNSNIVIVTVNPSPLIPVISQTGNMLSTTAYTTYQWYYAGTTMLGTDSSQIATVDGNYSVVVTNASGCSATSADFAFVPEGINMYAANEAINVYPNPSAGVFTYAIENADKASVIVYNILGKQILNTEVNKGTHTIDLSAQANGSYFMSIKTDKEVITKKIIVSK
ncbi:MAG: hypothetical protein JWP12_2228 [Bacteroidetes bacterium]|nr:hypothetical protein [Bacteroidota bacterium]